MTHQPKSYKKFVASAATATLVASALVPTASAATPSFTDVSKDYKEAVDYIVEHGFAQGTTETTFGTAQNISRGDAAVMIANALDLNTVSAPDAGFQDVNNRVAPSVNAIVEAGIASGRTSTKFDPAAYITRQEMAKMLANAYELEAETNAGFTDVNSNWIGYVSALKEAGITLGKTETTFAPEQNLTRGEFALFMFRAETEVTNPSVPAFESVSAINKTTVEVKFNTEVDVVKAENFTIEGASVSSATLSEDKKSATLTVSGLDYDKDYTLAAKDIEVDGEKTDFGSKAFSTPAVADLWNLVVETKDATLKADGADNTEVTFKLLNANGEVDLDADNIVLDLNTTFGTLAQKRVTIQDGQATVLLTSEFSNTNVTAKIDAQIIEASGDYKELIGKVVGTKDITFVTSDIENVNTVTLVSAEANQADRATLFFDKDVSIKHFVKTNSLGELLYTIGYNTPTLYTADELKALNTPAEDIFHALKTNAVIIDQNISPHNGSFEIKGIKPVSGNTKAVEVVLDKGTILTDNADVDVTVNTENSLGKITKSQVDFKVTDARVPSATGVAVEGLTTLKVKYSEPIAASTLSIDGRHTGVQVDNATEVADAIANASANQKFVYYFGDFNPSTQEDQRDVATLKLTENYKEDFQGAIGGYFGAGQHAIQASSTTDFAHATDRNNIGTTQNLNFTIAADISKPAATISVESAEQFRVNFDKSTNLNAASFQALFAGVDPKAKIQVYDKDSKEYVDIKSTDKLLQAGDLQFKQVTASEFVIELTQDWTKIYDTATTGKNYYNDQYRIVIAKETVTNVANGLQNDLITLNLNETGSALNNADVTSPVIDNIRRVATFNSFNVTMSEPVKLQGHVNGNDTLAQGQANLPTTTAQFMGVDKDGNKVTFNGTVNGYADEVTTKADKVLNVNWNPQYYALEDDAGKAGSEAGDALTETEAFEADGTLKANVATLTPQDIVNQGGNAEWEIVVRAISDDVGNTAASATAKFNIEKSAATETPFFIDYTKDAQGAIEYKVTGADNGSAADTVKLTFSEGVQWTGTSDATNPAQYTLNGQTLPEGTSIAIANDDTATHASKAGYEQVIITLPDGTLNSLTNESNVITVNKNLVSYDGSVIQGATEITFALTDAVDADLEGAVQAANAAIAEANSVIADGNGTLTDVQAARTALLAELNADPQEKADIEAATTVLKDAILALETELADQEEADAVDALITALPGAGDVELTHAGAIEAAREAYDALSADQQALVAGVAALEAAEVELDVLIAAEVDALIAALPGAGDVELTHADAIEAAREAYDALTADQQALVTDVAALEAAEAELAAL